MDRQQQRNGEAEPELHGLPGLQPEVVALPDRHQRVGDVDQEGGREESQAGLLLPYQDEQPEAALHHIQRDEAGRVVDQVAREEGEEDQPARQPQPLQPRSAPRRRCPGAGEVAQFSGPEKTQVSTVSWARNAGTSG